MYNARQLGQHTVTWTALLFHVVRKLALVCLDSKVPFAALKIILEQNHPESLSVNQGFELVDGI